MHRPTEIKFAKDQRANSAFSNKLGSSERPMPENKKWEKTYMTSSLLPPQCKPSAQCHGSRYAVCYDGHAETFSEKVSVALDVSPGNLPLK